MEKTAFDVLLRRVTRSRTRREALAALAGGALLLGNVLESDATKKAERRKKRRKKAGCCNPMPMTLVIDNFQGKADVPVRYGFGNNRCCRNNGTITVPAGQQRTLNSHDEELSVWINGMYWFQFENPLVDPVWVGIAIYGRLNYRTRPGCCDLPMGSTVEEHRTFKKGQTRTYNIENRAPFVVTRKPDMRTRKLFVLQMPPFLPGTTESA